MDWQERIVKVPGVMGGRPVIKGTRMTVELILEFQSDGWSEADILKNYPRLTAEDIAASLSYAAEHGMVAYADWDTEFCPYHHENVPAAQRPNYGPAKETG